jgi:hypothetical protein
MHLIATNLSLWLFTLIREVGEVLLSYEDRQSTTSDMTIVTTESLNATGLTTTYHPQIHRRSVTNSQQSTDDNSTLFAGLLLETRR